MLKARRAKAKEKRVENIYGITADEYDAILAYQGGVCAICRKGFYRKRGSVDHDHKREHLGMRASVRGIVHGWCNTMLGRAHDDPEFFERAAEYLRRPPAREVLQEGPRD